MKDWLKGLSCRLGWHALTHNGVHLIGMDGCDNHVKCKWCRCEGIIDSQGNFGKEAKDG